MRVAAEPDTSDRGRFGRRSGTRRGGDVRNRGGAMTNAILAVGEVLWDLLPTGKQLGGAPANFTYQCRSLGADAGLATRVGDDELGRDVIERFSLLGLPTDLVQVD